MNSGFAPVLGAIVKTAGRLLLAGSMGVAATAQGDSYHKTPNAAISGHNNRQVAGSVEDCKRACDSQTSFRCKSFDYYKRERKCDLSDKQASEVGGLKRDYAGNPYDHYERRNVTAPAKPALKPLVQTFPRQPDSSNPDRKLSAIFTVTCYFGGDPKQRQTDRTTITQFRGDQQVVNKTSHQDCDLVRDVRLPAY